MSSLRVSKPRRTRAKTSIRSSPAVRPEQPEVSAVPRLGIPSAAEIMRLKARGRTEADMIETALQDAPPLDRAGMGAELFPFNEIASAPSVQAVIEKIARRRNPDSPWHAAHKSLLLTDENGNGYADFIDTLRDVTFLIGVDYALRSRPAWWSAFDSLPDKERQSFAVLIEHTAHVMTKSTKGGGR